jgi:hypothetical protein
VEYTRDLARSIGREDLQLVGIGWLERDSHRGTMRPVLVDHAIWVSSELQLEISIWNERVEEAGYDPEAYGVKKIVLS